MSDPTTIEAVLLKTIEEVRRNSKAVMARSSPDAVYVSANEFRNLTLNSKCYVLQLPDVDENDNEIFLGLVNDLELYFCCSMAIVIDCAYNLELRFDSDYNLNHLLKAIKYYLEFDAFMPSLELFRK